ncbi:MAG: 2-dehydro-3-deoxyglucarate aldolase [Myxococcota bacterium]|jgi:2-dehydro-3-deoxyglucarate aldolase
MPSLKSSIRQGRRCVGGWLSLGTPAIAEILCRAGCEWVAIDLEHSPTSLETTQALIATIDGCGRSPLVRISGHDPVQIKRVMDAGAHGIIAPNVRSRAELDAIHSAMHYPPEGTRGVGLGRAQQYGAGFNEYRKWLAEEAVLIAQIEHIDALPHLDEIFESPALDAFFIGPYDLSASMGLAGQFEAPAVTKAVEQVLAAGRKHDRTAGYHVVEPSPTELQRRLDEGFSFVAYSVDFRMIDAACRAGLGALDG